MIYAIPTSRDNVANHFMKVKQFALVDENNTLIKYVDNPAGIPDSSCSDKSAAIGLLKSLKPDAIIIRNIGERSLGKLLSAGIRVFKVTKPTPISAAVSSELVELTDAKQGRPSTNHEKKGGCSHSHDHDHGHGIMKAAVTETTESGQKRTMRNLFTGISSIRSIK